jgi:predicted component of type VI protein secretion system
MGKLVLYLPDGTTQDIPLDKERLTIGRRPDNDVCLPNPAVSGEHAQVVTILADSFLEDLGSTNGTLVNGKSIVKHFLADYDQIDIGRQRLTYVSNNDVKVEALPPDLTRDHSRGLSERVEPARAVPQIEVPAAGDRRPQYATGNPLVADLEREIPRGPTLGVPPKFKVEVDDPLPGPQPAEKATTHASTAAPAASAELPRATPKPAAPTVKVLSGASQGRIVQFPGPELTVGRVGVQVAIVRKVETGFLLIPIEGREAPRINGAAIAPEGSPLHPGDTFEVAGVRLELTVPA